MPEFHSTLLREKFVIQDMVSADIYDRAPIVALSNRIIVPLGGVRGQDENFVIRAQNMHCCARLAAHVAREHQENGPLLRRARPFDWDYAWISLVKGYEKKWNPARWVAVYHKGRVIYEAHGEQGHRHPFVDVIEQCDARSKGQYEQSLAIAKDAFRQAGKLVDIQYESNVALTVHVTDSEGKCGLILRGPNRTTTFSFTARSRAGRGVRPSQCLSAAAAFLEGIQMTFMIAMARQKVAFGVIPASSDEARQGIEAGQKLGRLKDAIDQFERLLDVTYRPDRPDFTEMVDSALVFAKNLIMKKILEEREAGKRL